MRIRAVLASNPNYNTHYHFAVFIARQYGNCSHTILACTNGRRWLRLEHGFAFMMEQSLSHIELTMSDSHANRIAFRLFCIFPFVVVVVVVIFHLASERDEGFIVG